MREVLKFVLSSVVHVNDEPVLNKQTEPELGPSYKKPKK